MPTSASAASASRLSGRYPDRTSDRGRYDDYSRTSEYRRITSDADAYARRVNDQLRIGSGQERRIRDLLTARTARLLQQTNPRDHRAVYPFPRRFSGDSRAARSFWSSADRDIERILDRNDAAAYRSYVRGGGRYDRRSDDRRYEERNDRGNNGRGNSGRGRDDGERTRRGDDRRDDRRDRGTQTSRDDARRPGESLEDWYRRQAARRDD